MALNDISLTSGMRNNLFSLQSTSMLLDRTQTRLSTGKKVNSALDDPVNFFRAQAHTNRASDLAGLKDGMNEAIQVIKAADNGIKAITDLLNQAKSIANSAKTATDTAPLVTQYNGILDQINALAEDSGYGGTNLLGADATTGLAVTFNEDATNKLTVTGQDNRTQIGGQTIADATTFDATEIDTALTSVKAALEGLRSTSVTLSSSMSIITARMDFTSNMVNTLKSGADNLTLADMNEEGANMLMLQTRQALGTTALSLSSQAAQSVLRLF